MKKLVYIFSVLCLVVLSGCSNEIDYIFDKSPEERVAEFNAKNKAILVNNEHGWKGYYSPINDLGGFAITMKFTQEGNVTLKSERIRITGERMVERKTQITPANYKKMLIVNIPAKQETVGYDVLTSQSSKLVFKSHCILNDWHTASNISEVYVRDTIKYPLLGGEFQFTIKSATPDKIVLQSLTDKPDNATYFVLTPATSDDWKDIDYSKSDEIKAAAEELEKPVKYFRNLIVSTSTKEQQLNGQIKIDAEARVLKYSFFNGTKIEESFIRFSITENGIKMLETIKLANGKHIVNFSYDKSANLFISQDAGITTKIEYSDSPGIIYFPFVDMWGYKDGVEITSALQYSAMNMFRGGVVSTDFYDLCSALRRNDGLKTFDFYVNDKKNPSGSSSALTLAYNKVVDGMPFPIHVDIPVDIERVSNERIIFKLKGDYKDALKSNIKKIELVNPDAAKELVEVLTNEQGYYMIPTVFLFPETNEPYQVVIFISVANPKYRFVTEYFEYKILNK